MPAWMSSIHKKLGDAGTEKNVRLFIARLVTNRPKVCMLEQNSLLVFSLLHKVVLHCTLVQGMVCCWYGCIGGIIWRVQILSIHLASLQVDTVSWTNHLKSGWCLYSLTSCSFDDVCFAAKVDSACAHVIVNGSFLCMFGTFLCVFVVQIFQPYAKFWLPELARLVIAGDHGGEGLHYFVVDVLVTMLSWSSTAVLQVMWHTQKMW